MSWVCFILLESILTFLLRSRPQGAIHNVVRWVHRSSFVIRPPRGSQRAFTPPNSRNHPSRIPIPESDNLFVDSGWYGTIVVETEGTNEPLADLQMRCGPGAFPPRARGVNDQVTKAQYDNRKVFRILREKRCVLGIFIFTIELSCSSMSSVVLERFGSRPLD